MTIGIETVEAVVPVRGSVSICSAQVICGPIGPVGMAAHDGLVVSNEMEMGVGMRVDDAVCPIDLS